jgi:RNA-directed DNA polymerase from retron ec67
MSLFNSREKEYKKFLFYKYFFGNDKPIIVTEGKTDPRYIKAALKKLYRKYPELIEKVGNNFVFKIEFLNHTNTIEYLFNVPEGGEGFKYWYNYFSDKSYYNDEGKKKFFALDPEERILYANYITYFQQLTDNIPNYPTIFLFDNEPNNRNGKDKSPLFLFANHAKDLMNPQNKDSKTSKSLESKISDNLEKIRREKPCRINKNGSLYIMATPLVSSKNDGNFSDIEDLLLSRKLPPILKGKTFSKSGGDNHYGKEILSKHVLKNYEKFDFTEFIPLLDGIRDNILDYKSLF